VAATALIASRAALNSALEPIDWSESCIVHRILTPPCGAVTLKASKVC
jgi:hypothetical protein